MFRMNSNEFTQNYRSAQSDIYRLNIVFIQHNNKTEIYSFRMYSNEVRRRIINPNSQTSTD